MNMFKKLQGAVAKKEKNYSPFDDIVGREKNIEFAEIDKLKLSELIEIVRRYDAFAIKMRKDSAHILE
jgi:hypothetical protein